MGLQRPNETDIKVDDTVKKVADWLHNTMTGIDAENGKLSGMLTNCQRNDFIQLSSQAYYEHFLPNKYSDPPE